MAKKSKKKGVTRSSLMLQASRIKIIKKVKSNDDQYNPMAWLAEANVGFGDSATVVKIKLQMPDSVGERLTKNKIDGEENWRKKSKQLIGEGSILTTEIGVFLQITGVSKDIIIGNLRNANFYDSGISIYNPDNSSSKDDDDDDEEEDEEDDDDDDDDEDDDD